MMHALSRLRARLKGAKTFSLAFLLMVPDALQQFGALDWTTVLPAAGAAKVGFVLMAARILAVLLVTASARAPADPGAR